MPAPADHPLGAPPPAYAKLLDQLSQTAWFCQGTVVRRALRRKVAGRWVKRGPYYLWTGKRQGKTVCFALSHEQYEVAKSAIATNRKVMTILNRLQAATLDTILKKLPGVQKRK